MMTCLHYSSDMAMAKRISRSGTFFTSRLQSSLGCWPYFTCQQCRWNNRQILRDEDMFNDGNVEEDFWQRVSVSYLQRPYLRALEGSDEIAIERLNT
ncbi:hypothetical protein V1523DRAFT_414968 [Lipomyces doorenjongii]